MTTVATIAPTVQASLAAARRHLGIKLKDSREIIRSGGEEGLYRSTLADGTIVETTVKRNSTTQILVVETN
jgi:hypothetical protein